MNRRDFFEKSGCGLAGILVTLGISSCKRKAEPAVHKAKTPPPFDPAKEAALALAARKDEVKNILMKKMGKTAQEADVMIAEFEKKLDEAKRKCICETCPSFVPEENATAFCHPLVGKSKIIKAEKGCDCGQCPVHKEMGLKSVYFCTRGSEIEQAAAKTTP